jgi:hypothetical protein
MSSDQIPGVPDGWELVHANRAAMPRECFIGRTGGIQQWNVDKESGDVYPIIRKIEKPARYRPFANAAEFKPHRDRWWRYNDSEDSGRVYPPAAYSKFGPQGSNWEQAFSYRVFDDGTPFGVKVYE